MIRQLDNFFRINTEVLDQIEICWQSPTILRVPIASDMDDVKVPVAHESLISNADQKPQVQFVAGLSSLDRYVCLIRDEANHAALLMYTVSLYRCFAQIRADVKHREQATVLVMG